MDYDFAARFGELARDAGIVLSVHAPIAGFMGHAERGKKLNMAVGMLDHSAGIAKAAGAEVVVFHPGFLLGRTREEAIDSVVRAARRAACAAREEGQCGAVRHRGDGPRARARPAETSSRSRAAAAGCGRCSTSRTCTRPPTARSRPPSPSPRRSRKRTRCSSRAPRSTSTSRTSSSRTATRPSTCPTARGRCARSRSRDALAQFERPATVISESPDEESSQAIKSVLLGA